MVGDLNRVFMELDLCTKLVVKNGYTPSQQHRTVYVGMLEEKGSINLLLKELKESVKTCDNLWKTIQSYSSKHWISLRESCFDIEFMVSVLIASVGILYCDLGNLFHINQERSSKEATKLFELALCAFEVKTNERGQNITQQLIHFFDTLFRQHHPPSNDDLKSTILLDIKKLQKQAESLLELSQAFADALAIAPLTISRCIAM